MPSLGSMSLASVLTAVVLTAAGCYSGAPAPGATDGPLATGVSEASPDLPTARTSSRSSRPARSSAAKRSPRTGRWPRNSGASRPT